MSGEERRALEHLLVAVDEAAAALSSVGSAWHDPIRLFACGVRVALGRRRTAPVLTIIEGGDH